MGFVGFAWSNRGLRLWRRVKEFGPDEVFGAKYRDLTPLHEEFMTQAEVAENHYRQQKFDQQQ